MFQKIKDKKVIEKLNKIGRSLYSQTISLPTEIEVMEGMKELQETFFWDGKYIWPSYVRNVIIGLKWAQSSRHYFTNSTLFQDIVSSNKRIHIKSYKLDDINIKF